MLIILLYFNIIKEFMSYLKLQLFILKAISIYGAGPLPLKSALNAILEFAVVWPVPPAAIASVEVRAVAVPALPVIFPLIGFITVNPVSVPTLVIAGWAAVVTVPAVVEVHAFPVVDWFHVGTVPVSPE